jgi:hypothetical protein
MKFKNTVAFLIILSIVMVGTSYGFTRRIRVELAFGMGFLKKDAIQNNINSLQLENASINMGNTSGQFFVGTDVVNGITVGLLFHTSAVVEAQGQVDDSVHIEEIGQTFLSNLRYYQDYKRWGYFLTGRFMLTRATKTALDLTVGVGKQSCGFYTFTNRTFSGVPVSAHASSDRWISEWAVLLQGNVRFKPSGWISLFARPGLVLSPSVTFPEIAVKETISSPSGTDYRDLILREHTMNSTYGFLIFGIEVSPF